MVNVYFNYQGSHLVLLNMVIAIQLTLEDCPFRFERNMRSLEGTVAGSLECLYLICRKTELGPAVLSNCCYLSYYPSEAHIYFTAETI